MVGFITERDLEQAEQSFPGIQALFMGLTDKPRTFLELLARYDRWIPAPRSARSEQR